MEVASTLGAHGHDPLYQVVVLKTVLGFEPVALALYCLCCEHSGGREIASSGSGAAWRLYGGGGVHPECSRPRCCLTLPQIPKTVFTLWASAAGQFGGCKCGVDAVFGTSPLGHNCGQPQLWRRTKAHELTQNCYPLAVFSSDRPGYPAFCRGCGWAELLMVSSSQRSAPRSTPCGKSPNRYDFWNA